MDKKIKLKYIDLRPIYIPYLPSFPNGLSLSKKDTIIEVSEKEVKTLLKYKNGNMPIFEIIKDEMKTERKKNIIENNKE